MALFPLPNLQRFASKLDSLRRGSSRKGDRKAGRSKSRRLLIDTLEQRQLLSLAPADYEDIVVNETVSEDTQFTLNAQSLAADDDGDFVVAWTRYDPVFDPTTGQPVIDPATGDPMVDANIYARYFTDEVQRLTLPPEIVANNVPGQYGSFMLVYGGNEVQKLSITATYEPFTYPYWQDYLNIDFRIGFDLDGNGVIGAGETTQTIFFNEFAGLETNAKQIEVQLRGLGGALTDVTVQPINPHEFEVRFGDLSGGLDQPELVIDPVDITVNTGFLPAITVDTLREPIEIGPIIVSPDDPNLTATSIEGAFLLRTTENATGPINFPPPSRVPGTFGPHYTPETLLSPVAGVSIRPISTTEFEVTFDGDQALWDHTVGEADLSQGDTISQNIAIREGTAGKKNHPELVVLSAQDDLANPIAPTAFDVQTLKEPSQEFRVNPEEPDNPFTPLPDGFTQRRPSVAMDADGEFVITWESEVPDSENFGSITDIFARRFTAVGLVNPTEVDFIVDTDLDGVAEDPVQGVKALVNAEVEYVQRLTFNANNPGPLVGTFKFQIDGPPRSDQIEFSNIQRLTFTPTTPTPPIPLQGTFQLNIDGTLTSSIDFDSDLIATTRANIETAIQDAGFPDATVSTVNSASPYQFDVDFGLEDTSGLVVYVPDTMPPLDPAIDVVSASPAAAEAVALSIEQELLTADYRDVTVTVVSGTDPYEFEVRFRKTFKSAVGPDDATSRTRMTIFPVDLDATVSTANLTQDDLLTFRVNTDTTNAQGQPSVGMDDHGNFVIAWGSGGQDISFFNDVRAQRYDRDGQTVGTEFVVNNVDTNFHHEPYVGVSHDGNFVVTWSRTTSATGTVGVFYRGFGSDGQLFTGQTSVGGGGSSAVSFDRGNNFFITWSLYPAETDNIGISSTGSRAQGYDIQFDALGNPTGATVFRPAFAVNSADFNTGRTPLWPLRQSRSQIVADADGDLVAVYDGFGPDTSNTVSMSSTFFQEALNDPANADLAALHPFGIYLYSVADVDEAIEQELIAALNAGATNEQVGRLRKLLDDAAGLLRGEANGIMVSVLDANPGDQLNILTTDSVTNAERSGHNQRYIVTVSRISTGGNFVLRMRHPNRAGYEDITITPVYTNNVLNVGRTQTAIETALRGATRTGINWPVTAYEGPVEVRTLQDGWGFFSQEILDRQGTPWDLVTRGIDDTDAVFEVTFQGEVHDTGVSIYLQTNDLTDTNGDPAPAPDVILHTAADGGITQANASIAIEPDGDFVVVWTQYEEYTQSSTSNRNIYYRRFVEDTDTAGPQVTDFLAHKGIHVEDDDLVEQDVTHLVLTFDEDMLSVGVDAVTNVENYILRKDGVELPGGIAGIQFGMNRAASLAGTVDPLTGTLYDTSSLPSNKWEAVFTLDGNGEDPGIGPLDLGLYTIEAIAAVDGTPTTPAVTGLRDRSGNPLGFNGYNVDGVDFSRDFVVSPQQGDTQVIVDGRTFPESAQAVAVDADGDHVIVWTAFDTTLGRDRVYIQLFDADGQAPSEPGVIVFQQVTPFALEPFREDDQRFGTVAVDKDGDFVVTWTNYRDGQQDIYARRFNADGTPVTDPVSDPLGSPLLVNSFTFGNQRISSVGMDTDGDFVIAWSSYGQESATTGQPGLGYGVYARAYDSAGQPRSPEFLINETTLGSQRDPAVAIDSDGGFVVSWTSDQGGTDDVFARVFAVDGTPVTAEARINTTVAGAQDFPDVAFDLPGQNFVVTWTSSGDQDGDALGVFTRVFTAATVPLTGEIQVNTSTAGDQHHSSVAMNHPGDFVVTWGGLGDQPFQEDQDQSGIFYQRYDFDPATGATPVGGEIRANDTTEGSQRFASVDADGEGNFVTVWTGDVNGSTMVYLFSSTNQLPVIDVVGPIVTDVLLPDRTPVHDGDTITSPSGGLTELIVIFGENLSDADPAFLDSVTNPNNWVLQRNGSTITGAIASVDFALNTGTRKLEATLYLDGNGTSPPNPLELPPGDYTLIARDPITDGINRLDGDFNGVPGSNFSIDFTLVGDTQDDPIEAPDAVDNRTFPESAQAVAVDADGDHVLVFTAFDNDLNRDRVFIQLFDADGDAFPDPDNIVPIQVTPVTGFSEFGEDDQRFGTVAADKDGDFIVTWTNYRDGDTDVYARRYNAFGEALGGPFLVNTFGIEDPTDVALETNQKWSHVAMDADGDFVITWASRDQETGGQPGAGYGIYARRYDGLVAFNQAQVLPPVPLAPEFQVNVTTAGEQRFPTVAMDALGGFVVAWTSEQGPVGEDIIARVYGSDGAPFIGPLTGEIFVNTVTDGNQRLPNVSTNLSGDTFVATWTSSDQDGSGDGVFARVLDRTGAGNAEFQVNTTTTGNQMFSSVAMDHQGDFVVTWSGYGDQFGQEDSLGVFYQRFNADETLVAGETRVNRPTNVIGTQWLSSIGSDGEGNFVIVYTGDVAAPVNTAIFPFVSIVDGQSVIILDNDGPIVTDVLKPDGGTRTRILPNDVLEPLLPGPGVRQELIVVFGEELNQAGTDELNSVLNPLNWTIAQNGTEIVAGINSVSLERNPLSRKWEATLTLDGNGPGTGIIPLEPGDYVLTARNLITDLSLNQLDGDFDGVPGTAGRPGYEFPFSIADEAELDGEFRVNSTDADGRDTGTTGFEQRIGLPAGTGSGVELNKRSLAVDHDGDYVVVWTSYGQDDPSDPTGTGVFYRMYDRNDDPLTPTELQANVTTDGHQRSPSVAIDADGEFVIVWEAEGQDVDGSYAIVGRRFSSVGQPISGEFPINTTFTNDQLNPSIGMDDSGNFVVVWANVGPELNFFNDVRAQAFDYLGERLAPEFVVSQTNEPNVQNLDLSPVVAMDDVGNYVVVWERATAQTNGVGTAFTMIMRSFDVAGASTAEATIAGRNPQLTSGPTDLFGLTAETFALGTQDVLGWTIDTSGAGAPVAAIGTINDAVFGGAQVNPSVAVDAEGRLFFAWNGNGGQPDPLNPTDPNLAGDLDDQGVFIRQLDASQAFATVQSRVNRTVGGIQQFPSIGTTKEGETLVVWAGRGVGDPHGIFARRYVETVDNVGPLVTELREADATLIDATESIDPPQYFVVTFDEDMWTLGDDSVENVENWILARNGIELDGSIVRVEFGLNKASDLAGQIDPLTGALYDLNPNPTNKYEAVVTVDGNTDATGLTPLAAGNYTLTALRPIADNPGTPADESQSGLRDAAGNPIGQTGSQLGGQDAVMSFAVLLAGDDTSVTDHARTHPETPGAVAVDPDGDTVVVFTATNDDPNPRDRVYYRLFDADGTAVGSLLPVTTDLAFADDHQRFGTVATDADGDFVVTWTNYRDGDADIYAQRFNAKGTAQDDAFLVNTFGVPGSPAVTNQKWSDVAVDVDGDFVIVWSSYAQETGGQLGSGYGVYARRYDSTGTPLDSQEFILNTTTPGNQSMPSVAITSDGTFYVAWTSDQNGIGDDIVGRGFSADRSPLPGALGEEDVVNDFRDGDQRYADVAMNLGGTKIVVTWSSFGQNAAGWEVYAKALQPETVIQNPTPLYIAPIQTPLSIGSGRSYSFRVPDAFVIDDLDTNLDIDHPDTRELDVFLTSPAGTRILLFSSVPRSNPDGSFPAFNQGFQNTTLDDEAAITITDSNATPVPASPFNGSYAPQEALRNFDGQNAQGWWTIDIIDRNGFINNGFLTNWSLQFEVSADFGPEFQVNQTVTENQLYSSVAMDATGDFVVTWSGFGNQPNQESESESGVYFRQYTLTGTASPRTGEMRANRPAAPATPGRDHWFPSVGSDGDGNFMIAWTGIEDPSGDTDVFLFNSKDTVLLEDIDGPMVADVLLPNGDRLYQNSANPAALFTQVTVVFSEDLSIRERDVDGDLIPDGPGPDSVFNSTNWVLLQNDTEIAGAVSVDSFGFNAGTNKYEATISFDGNGVAPGTPPLSEGEYVLVVRSDINDKYKFHPVNEADTFDLGNRLDGDFDGNPGTALTANGYPGYSLSFFVTDTVSHGPEFRVNETTDIIQRFAEPNGTGFAAEESTRSVAVDHDGDFAVVWTGYGGEVSQNPGADPADGVGIFMRFYHVEDDGLVIEDIQPLTGDVQVNTTTAGLQKNATIAMDADGDFVVVWQSENLLPNGMTDIDVYGQRFDATGQPVAGEFLINNGTYGQQHNPAVAMDDFGNFVVVWVTDSGQPLSFFHNLYARMYDANGIPLATEFRVNEVDIPGDQTSPSSAEVNPAVVMANDQSFIVAWDRLTNADHGTFFDSNIVARMFDGLGSATTGEFQVDTNTAAIVDTPEHTPVPPSGGGAPELRAARNPQMAMDASGNFLVVWEAYRDNDVGVTAGATGADADSYGIYFREYFADGTPARAVDHQANLTITSQPPAGSPAVPDPAINSDKFAYAQVNPSIGIDADGDYAVIWNGNGATADPFDPRNADLGAEYDPDGIFVRQFHAGFENPPGSWQVEPDYLTPQWRVNYTDGGIQQFPTLAMEPDGDFIMVWAGAGVGDTYGINARRFNEPTDTAGPTVSDLVAPSGARIPQAGQVIEGLTSLVVVFDEEMMTTGPDSVLNPDNYRLLRDGMLVSGMITGITFDLNSATNKWEAVLTLDGNGSSPGVPPLEDGHYELVIANTLRDVVGNPLGSTGLNPDGDSVSWTFILFDITSGAAGGEIRVNTDLGAEFTYAHATQPVAADADGDYVTVWANETPGAEGIYAGLVDVTWTEVAGERVSVVTPLGEIIVTTEPTATSPSVARDGDGDFVVTWSQYSPLTSWDVYARRYDSVANPLSDPFLVNTETEDVQQFSSVAMDLDGDFVITWQSHDQDGDGYGIYAQRFSPAGVALGGTNEIQLINLVGNPVGTFALRWEGDPTTPDETGLITVSGSALSAVAQIETELAAIGAEVELDVISGSEIVVRFIGTDGSRDQQPISVVNQSIVGDPGAQVAVTTPVQGSSGEFLVNDTTANDQKYATVAMDSSGDFVVTWTSYGQDGDAGFESNVYARRFAGNDTLRGTTLAPTEPQAPTSNSIDKRLIVELYLGALGPDSYVIGDGIGFDGVAQVNAGGGFGSGALLTTGIHVLTASHVVTGAFGEALPAALVSVTFSLPGGPVTLQAKEVWVHPSFNGDTTVGGDIAIVELVEAPPVSVERYDIYRDRDEVGKIGEKFGFGNTGQGDLGFLFVDGQRRGGQNRYEATGNELDPGWSDALLVYDFDNGLPQNDAFGVAFHMNDLGLGTMEVSGAPGDSGGPTFIDGKIAAVTSFGITADAWVPGIDVDGGTNFSFGEFIFDTRTSVYADWIDAVTATGPEFLVNEDAFDPITLHPIDNQSGDQKWSSVAMDADGDFIITWTSYGHDGVGDGYGAGYDGLNGVFARRFSGAAAVSEVFQVNTFEQGNQQHSRVAMDADGDFVITWESHEQDGYGYGIYAQRYASNQHLLDGLFLGSSGEIGGEFAFNETKEGDQRYPGIAMDDTGDFVIVWSGYGNQPGQEDTQGIFERRFEKAEDDAGPTVTDVFDVITEGGLTFLGQLFENPVLGADVSQFVINLGEDASVFGGENGAASILNPFNWELTKDGGVLAGGIASIEFGLNRAFNSGLTPARTNKYETVITFDGDPTLTGAQPLEQGVYVLTARDDIEDLFENPLDGEHDGTPGGNFNFQFGVSLGLPSGGGPGGPGDPSRESEDPQVNLIGDGEQGSPAVASNANGDYVVVWMSSTQSPTPGVFEQDVMARLHNRFGQSQGAEFIVSSFSSGVQIEPDVAMDYFGNFVVTWSGVGEDDDSGVFGRVFDAFGAAQSEDFRVNQYRAGVQDAPQVDMDASGDFVITWTSFGQDEDQDGVYARRYNFRGQPTSSEFRVNTEMVNRQNNSDVALDSDGDFVIVWNSFAQDGNSWGVFGQRFNAVGEHLGGEFRVNQYVNDKQVDPQVSMDADGNFAVAWQSFGQDGNGYGIYGRRYNAAGTALSGEFRANETTLHWQQQPALSMADDGSYVVTWTTYAQDDDMVDDNGIYARMYNPNGSDVTDATTGEPLGEWRVNATTLGNQFDSAVAMDADGDFAIVWTGPDIDGNGIYGRIVAVNTESYNSSGSVAGFGPYTGNFTADAKEGLTPESVVVTLTGTDGPDTFEFTAGAPGSWTVKVNGVTETIEAGTRILTFEGGLGDDTVIFTGSGGHDDAELWSDHGVFSGPGYTLNVNGVESITADMGDGTDFVVMHGTDGDGMEELLAYRHSAAFTGPNLDLAATGYESLSADSGAGPMDTALLHGTIAADHFYTDPVQAKLTDQGDVEYELIATGFPYVHGYAEGGHDTAEMWDQVAGGALSTGDESVYAYDNMVKMIGETSFFFRRAKNFHDVKAYATGHDPESPWGDAAYLRDGDQDDVFTASPEQSLMEYDVEYPGGVKDVLGPTVTVVSFDYVHGYAIHGGTDTAYLTDSPGNDRAIATPWYTKLFNEVDPAHEFFLRAKYFEEVHATADSGGTDDVDVATMVDSTRRDAFTADPNSDLARMKGLDYDYDNRLWHFDEVYANANAGGYDTAVFNQAVGAADHLDAGLPGNNPEHWAKLYSDAADYLYRIQGFERANADTDESQDKAHFDTAGEVADWLFTDGWS